MSSSSVFATSSDAGRREILPNADVVAVSAVIFPKKDPTCDLGLLGYDSTQHSKAIATLARQRLHFMKAGLRAAGLEPNMDR